MAELAQHSDTFESLKVRIYGLSVDTPEQSENIKSNLNLPFELLSIEDRSLLKGWGILNSKEREGLAYPNVYVVDCELKIIFHSPDRKASRVDSKPLIAFLKAHSDDVTLRKVNKELVKVKPLFKEYLMFFPRYLGWTKK